MLGLCSDRPPSLPQEQQMMETLPYLLNVNEDPQLTGVLKYFIQAGTHPSRATLDPLRLLASCFFLF